MVRQVHRLQSPPKRPLTDLEDAGFNLKARVVPNVSALEVDIKELDGELGKKAGKDVHLLPIGRKVAEEHQRQGRHRVHDRG